MKNTRANQIVSKQSELQRELDKIRSKCNHTIQHIKFDYNNKRHMWRCDECLLDVRYPSDSELDKYLHS